MSKCKARLITHEAHPEFGRYYFYPVCHTDPTLPICQTLIERMAESHITDYRSLRDQLLGTSYSAGATE